MKAQDIVAQLAVLLPQYTDKFTTDYNIISLTRSGTTVTCQTDVAHGLTVNKQVNITGAKTPLTINSLTRTGIYGTLITDNPHDLTENYLPTVELTGATEAEFNGDFSIISIPDRYTVVFQMTDAGPTTATGSPLLLNGSSALQQYNGLRKVETVPTADTFTYEITNTTLYSPAYGTITAKTSPRISAIASPDVAIDAYTAMGANDFWAFVSLGDVIASKSRAIESDATDNLQRSNHYRQQLIFPLSILVFIPTSTQILARKARDDAEEIFRPLCRSLLGSKLDSGLYTGSQNPISFVSHGLYAYNKAYYIHQYNFETVADLSFDDTIGYDLDVAFRDIDLSMYLDIGTGEDPLTAAINLDDTVV